MQPTEAQRISPPRTWESDSDHFLQVIESPWYRALVDVQNALTTATCGFYSLRGYPAMQFPVTTCSISSPMGLGSDSLPVKINLFGVETYLADSMQFMLEYGCRLTKSGCYYLMPSFRGEHADKTHLCQFYHSEAEIVGGLEDVIGLVESYVRHLCQEVLRINSETILRTAGTLQHIEQLLKPSALPRVTVDEACALLQNDAALVQHHSLGFRTIRRQGERALTEHYGGAVWLTHMDHLSVPFYQAFAPDKSKALAADLLLEGVEVVGSGERHCSAEQVLEALRVHNVDPAPYEWYIRLKDRYPYQTAGFGLGVERFICWLLRHDDVRDCQILPRFNGQITIP